MAAKPYNPLEHSVVQALMKADGYQSYEVERGGYVSALLFQIVRHLERVYWNWNQEQFDNRKDWQFLEIPGFEYRRYFWGDCDCGFDAKDHEWSACHAHKQECFNVRSEAFQEDLKKRLKWLSKPYIAAYDKWAKENGWPYGWNGSGGYCDCGHNAEYAEWRQTNGHADTCSPQLPNMAFDGVKISWYKYLDRGCSTNVDYTEKQWREWFDKLVSIIKLYDWCMQTGHQALRDRDVGIKPFSTDTRVQCSACKYCLRFGANAVLSQEMRDEA